MNLVVKFLSLKKNMKTALGKWPADVRVISIKGLVSRGLFWDVHNEPKWPLWIFHNT